MRIKVKEDEHQSVLKAMLVELGEVGYGNATLAGVAQRVGVSVEAVEAEVGDKDKCLFAAYEEMSRQIFDRVALQWDLEHEWPQRVRAGLELILTEIASYPLMATVVTREFPAIRPDAYDHYVGLLSRFVPAMREGRQYSSVDEELPAEVELLAIGAAEAIVFGEIVAGRAENLPQMLPEILFSVLVPFMGPERAAEEMRSAQAR